MSECREKREDIAWMTLATQFTDFKDLDCGGSTSSNSFPDDDTGRTNPILGKDLVK